VSGVSERRACQCLQVARSAMRPPAAPRPVRHRLVSDALVAQIQPLIEQHPTFGYRRIWALLRFRAGCRVNRKAVYRVLKLQRWLVHQRPWTPRPRVRGSVSRAARSNARWAMDVTHVACGRDGWAHLAAGSIVSPKALRWHDEHFHHRDSKILASGSRRNDDLSCSLRS
jgi:putative transposase